jgi:hypothetical protein
MSDTANRINLYAQKYKARKYLEIGVNKGDTFFSVDLPLKVAVDPAFLFDPADHQKDGDIYLPITSDEFFATFPGHPDASRFVDEDGRLTFDIIFIDGLHTFEQSLRDFENSLAFAHDKTIWLLDDTVPNDAFSTIPDMDKAFAARKHLGLASLAWHGDVFKTLLAIHDSYPEFSYFTAMEGDNPKTVLWKSIPPMPTRKPRFASRQEIAALGYVDMLTHADLFMPIKDRVAGYNLIGKKIDPVLFADADTWKALLYETPVTINEVNVRSVLIKLRPMLQELEAQNKELRENEQRLKERIAALELARDK